MKKLSAVVVGFGGRGATYARYAMEHPEELEILAVAIRKINSNLAQKTGWK